MHSRSSARQFRYLVLLAKPLPLSLRPRGNPAVLGDDPLDRKLCVLAFQRVCPWNNLIIGTGWG
jgi:hypothetical protein